MMESLLANTKSIFCFLWEKSRSGLPFRMEPHQMTALKDAKEVKYGRTR